VPFPRRGAEDAGLITHNRDITEQKLLELSLKEAQDRLFDALTHMADGLVMFDENGRLVLCSARFRQMFSIPAEAMLTGTPLRSILEQAAAHFHFVLPEGTSNAEWVEDELEKVRRLEPVEMHMTDGRWIHVRHAAVSRGGWLSVFSDITERKRSEHALIELNARLSILAQTDGLTGLANRKTFDDRLYAKFARSKRHGTKLGLLLADIDRFKAYNDMYGHPEGDTCLRAVADCLKRCAKRPNDVVARYGGEEFVAIFPETDEAGLQAIADDYLQAVRDLQRVHVGSEKGVVTVSVGVAVMAADSDLRGPADLLRVVDAALYRAKGAGRDCIRFANMNGPRHELSNQRAS
jgi:diguanylate cyclase (GGDEF)-like protein